MKIVLNGLLTLILILFSTNAVCAKGGCVKGVVQDSLSDAPLVGAVVRIETTARGANVNKSGEFFITAIPAGNYILTASLIGYLPAKIPVVIRDDDTLNLNISLRAQAVRSATIIVSASKHAQSVQDVPISISVVEAKQLQERNITKIDDALRYVPGVNMSRDQVSIRGSSGFALGLGSRVALLLDGFPMLSGDNGDMKFDALPFINVERVEVIKGAGSALYGTGALGGVVSLFTKEPTDTQDIRIRAFGGFYTQPKYEGWRVFDSPPEEYGFDASFVQKFGDVSVTVSGGTKYDKSYRLFDDSKRWNFYTKLGFALSQRTSLSGFINAAGEDHANWVFWNSLDSATRPPTNTNLNERVNSQKLASAIELKHFFNDEVFLIVRSGIYSTDFHNEGLLDGVQEINSKATVFNSEAQLSAKLSRDFFLTSGLNATFNAVESPIYGSPKQNILSAYTQVEYSGVRRFIFTIGGRFDGEKTDSAEQNIQFNPKAGISYNSPIGIQFRASMGRGFRAPMVGERFAALRFQGITVVPNLALLPEESWSFEGGMSHEFDLGESPCSIDMSYFQNELFQLVEPVFILTGATPNIKFQNITRARIQGMEVSFKSFINKIIGLETSLTLMNPRIYELDVPLAFRSPALWYTKLYVPIGSGFEVQADYRFIARVEQIDPQIAEVNSKLKVIPDAEARVASHVLDARLMYNLKDSFDTPITLTL
ncbi:MAG: TonB-dependent receptor, partial [Ignavibacteriae bacterium]|nr:TonB-dependent receptor [Ignavibacteriota bacterium]